MYLSLHSDVVRVSVVLGVASQLSKLWRNDSGSTGKKKIFNKIFGSGSIRPKCHLRNLEADVTSCVSGVAGTDYLCLNIAFIATY